MNERLNFALRAQQTDNFRALCREYGISPRVGYKWRQRLLERGVQGFGEESRRPRQSGRQLSEEVICRMVRLKQAHPHWGPRKIREIYRRQHGARTPSESSFKRVLERAGMTGKRPRRRRAQQAGRIATGRVAQAPNDIWSVDFKGWWHDREGKCSPLTVRDEFSRYVLAVAALADGTAASVRACFEELFARHGLPGAIRSDNGPPFASSNALLGLSKLSAWWLALGIDLERSRPGCPQDNGAHERLHRDIATEVQGFDYEHRQGALDVWRREHNEERPHEALGQRCPAEVYTPSARRWQGAPEQLHYPGQDARRVQRKGCIKVHGANYFLSEALSHWDVGLTSLAERAYEVRFAQLLLGRIDLSTQSFQPALPRCPASAPHTTPAKPRQSMKKSPQNPNKKIAPMGAAPAPEAALPACPHPQCENAPLNQSEHP